MVRPLLLLQKVELLSQVVLQRMEHVALLGQVATRVLLLIQCTKIQLLKNVMVDYRAH